VTAMKDGDPAADPPRASRLFDSRLEVPATGSC
jgi:hypothetical protein